MTHSKPRLSGRRLFAVAGVLAVASGTVSAHEYFLSQVGLLVEYYEVDQEILPPLLRESQKQEDASGFLKQVGKMEAEGKSRLVESVYLTTRSGHRAKIESIREHIFPTEFDPPELPQQLTGPVDPGTNLITPTSPTAFEMYPVGMTLEADPRIRADEKFIDLNLRPQRLEYHGLTNWGKDESATAMPYFHRQRSSIGATLKSGGTELLGVYTASSGGQKVLCFASVSNLAAASRADFDAFKADPEKWMLEKDQAEQRAAEKSGMPPQISVLTEYIEVDAATAGRIANEIAQSGCIDATQIRHRLDAAVKDGKAVLLESKTSLTRSGIRSKTESHNELIYPTEYDPPEVPKDLAGPVDRDLKITTPSNPTAFEMRPVGATVELDPVYNAPNSSIDINIAPEMVRYTGRLAHGRGDSKAEQPVFESLKISTSVSMADGTTILLGMHSLESARAANTASKEEQKAARGRRVLVFLTSTLKNYDQ